MLFIDNFQCPLKQYHIQQKSAFITHINLKIIFQKKTIYLGFDNFMVTIYGIASFILCASRLSIPFEH